MGHSPIFLYVLILRDFKSNNFAGAHGKGLVGHFLQLHIAKDLLAWTSTAGMARFSRHMNTSRVIGCIPFCTSLRGFGFFVRVTAQEYDGLMWSELGVRFHRCSFARA